MDSVWKIGKGRLCCWQKTNLDFINITLKFFKSKEKTVIYVSKDDQVRSLGLALLEPPKEKLQKMVDYFKSQWCSTGSC